MSSTGGNRTCKQRWVLFPSSLQKVLLPPPLWVSPYHHHRCLAQKLVFPHSLSLLLCKTQILPHHSAATQDSHINPHRTETGCSSPHSITAAPAGHSFSFWLPLAMSLFAVKAHVIPRRKGHAEARNPQADRHGEMNPVFQEGCRADGSLRASVTWRGGDGLQVCQETPGHRAGRARADERNEQVLTKKTFSVVSLPQGCFCHESSQICWFDSRLRAGCALHAWKAQRNTDIRLIT